MENIVVVSPIPSASATMAIADVPGRLTIIRAPYRRSWTHSRIW